MDPKTAKLVSLLYKTLDTLDGWSDFLNAAAALFDARGAQIVHQDMRDFRLSFTEVSGYDWSAETYAALIPDDPRLDLLLQRPGQALHCRMQMTDAEYHRSRVYREVLCDAGVEYICGVNFGENRQNVSGMFLLRDQSQTVFTDEDCARLEILIPHIRQVLALHGFIGRINLENRILSETLDRLGAGVIVIDGTGKIEVANQAALALLAQGGNIRDIDGCLACSGRNGETLQDMLRLVWTTRDICPFEVLRESGEPLLLFVSPHEPDQGRYDAAPLREDGAVVVIRSSDQRLDIAAQVRVLELLWKLTPSQSRLACLLGSGHTLRSAATEMGITEASARQYLKTVFQKLGVNRQNDLMRKVTRVLVAARHD